MLVTFKRQLSMPDGSAENLEIITVPFAYRILTVQLQHRIPTVWYVCDTDSSNVELKIYRVGTGIEMIPGYTRHIGTVQLDGYVWHYFI